MNGLLQAGIRPRSTAMIGDGFPDIAAAFRGIVVLLEVKRHGEALTDAERKFRETWPGAYAVVYTAEEAINAVIDHAKECGKI